MFSESWRLVMALLTLGLFCGALLLCVVLDWSILYALGAGLILFGLYARRQGSTWRELGGMIWSGIKTARNVLIVLALIGILTALWRASGTIPVIICYAAGLVRPGTVVLMAFVLCCGVSVLTGTAFGTAATMGVISMTMGLAMGANAAVLGGAILAGSFFGDRCSPVSTSALLVAELTHTTVYDNLLGMVKTALIPFLLSCAVYFVAGLGLEQGAEALDLRGIFQREVVLHWCAIIPAVLILGLSALRVNVKLTMAASILAAAIICFAIQKTPPLELLRVILLGYEAGDAEAAALLNGGGVRSMVKVMAIITISSSFSGIFQGTDLLDDVKEKLTALAGKITPFGATVLTGAIGGMVACNQTLAIMLTHQLCRDLEPDERRFALWLEDSAVVTAPLVPWSIASGVPLASVGAPTIGILWGCYLYLLPMFSFFRWRRKAKPGSVK